MAIIIIVKEVVEKVTVQITKNVADMKKQIYDTNDSGVVDDAEKVNGLTVETAVPSGALFTDTIYDDTPVTDLENATSNIDNTSDANKPVSTAQQTALNLKADKSNVLELDNTTSFTPDADYEPATKKYVDDNAGGGKFVDGTDPLDAVYMDGNVGIGKQPSVKLDVDGVVRINNPTATSENLNVFSSVGVSKKNGTPYFTLRRTDSTGIIDDQIGSFGATGNNSVGSLRSFAGFTFYITDPTNGAEIGRASISTIDNGVFEENFTVNGKDVGINITDPKSKLDVNGGVKIADDTDVASVDKEGTFKYVVTANSSTVYMCMQTAAATWTWEIIKQNNW